MISHMILDILCNKMGNTIEKGMTDGYRHETTTTSNILLTLESKS